MNEFYCWCKENLDKHSLDVFQGYIDYVHLSIEMNRSVLESNNSQIREDIIGISQDIFNELYRGKRCVN